jgi:hypothetical protein
MAEDDHQDPAERIPDPRQLVAVLADTAKLRIFSALVLSTPGDGLSVEQAAEAAGASPAEARRALANLTAIGLAMQEKAQEQANEQEQPQSPKQPSERFRATPEILRTSLRELSRRRDEAAAKAFTTDDPARLAVLLSSFRDGRLAHLPEKAAKRQIVLEEIAQSFEPGVRYPEAEVNGVLQGLHADYAALRRYLIDSGLLSRAEGYYWRSGGTVAV